MFSSKNLSNFQNILVTNDSYRKLATNANPILAFSLPEETINNFSNNLASIPKYYVLNEPGDVLLVTLNQDPNSISADLRELFKRAVVFMSALTAALAKKDKDINDYESVKSIIENSGYFFNTHTEDRELNYSESGITLNTAIIGDIMSSFEPVGGTLNIAKGIVRKIGNKLRVAKSNNKENQKIAHFLITCENLWGFGNVHLSLFNFKVSWTNNVTESNCHETIKKEIKLTYGHEDYLFVDPSYIKKFSSDFQLSPEYTDLIDNLANFIAEE